MPELPNVITYSLGDESSRLMTNIDRLFYSYRHVRICTPRLYTSVYVWYAFSIMDSRAYIVYNIHCTLYTVHCTVYNVYMTSVRVCFLFKCIEKILNHDYFVYYLFILGMGLIIDKLARIVVVDVVIVVSLYNVSSRWHYIQCRYVHRHL